MKISQRENGMGIGDNRHNGPLIGFALIIAVMFTITIVADGYSNYQKNKAGQKAIDMPVPLTGSEADAIKLTPFEGPIFTTSENQTSTTLPNINNNPTVTYTPNITMKATSTRTQTSQEPTSTGTTIPVNTSTPQTTYTATTTPIPTVTPAPTITSTPYPTNTQRPTSTPRPSNTPRPTHTPRPTKTPK